MKKQTASKGAVDSVNSWSITVSGVMEGRNEGAECNANKRDKRRRGV